MGEQARGCGQFVPGIDAQDAIVVEQGFISGIVACQCAGMALRQSSALFGAPHLDRDNGNVPCGGLVEHRTKAVGISHGLQEQRNHPRALQFQGIIHVVGGRDREFLPGGDAQVMAVTRINELQGQGNRCPNG